MHDENLKIRPEIMDFAAAMEWKLRSHDEERGDSWKSESDVWLIDRILKEFRELDRCQDKKLELQMAEAVDISAFSMFLWWNQREYLRKEAARKDTV